jgi:hypothetical protein
LRAYAPFRPSSSICSTAGGTTCAVTWDLAERQSMVRQAHMAYGC